MDQSLPSNDDFFCRLRHCNPLEKTHFDYQNLIDSGCNTEIVMKKLKLTEGPPLGKTTMLIYSKQGALKKCNRSRTFLRWYINKDIRHTLAAIKK